MVARKDLTELFRNRLGLVLLIVMPLFMMVMVGFIYPSNGADLSNLKVAIVNQDSGYMGFNVSENFTTALNAINDASTKMTFTNVTNVDSLKDSIQRGDLDGGIILPENLPPPGERK